MSVQIAARFFRMSEATITRRCQAGTFPNAYQLGGPGCQWHIPAADILNIIPAATRDAHEQKLELLVRLYEMQETREKAV